MFSFDSCNLPPPAAPAISRHHQRRQRRSSGRCVAQVLFWLTVCQSLPPRAESGVLRGERGCPILFRRQQEEGEENKDNKKKRKELLRFRFHSPCFFLYYSSGYTVSDRRLKENDTPPNLLYLLRYY